MPESRPITTVQVGDYDEPPADAEASSLRSRRNRLQQALRATANILHEEREETRRSVALGRTYLARTRHRRRQHSPDVNAAGDIGGETTGTDDPDRRRAKRRRLDLDQPSIIRDPIKYGHFGQVEVGKLKLEIISCDGGEHSDPRHPDTYLGPQNLLKHDKSVYCSERPTSSIVLRHLDDTPFCLEKLHVVGPDNGFTAPVREGLVYVAMSLSDLSQYMDPPPHARLHGFDTPPYRQRRDVRPPTSRMSFTDTLRALGTDTVLDARGRDMARNDLATFHPPHYGDVVPAPSHTEFNFECDILGSPESLRQSHSPTNGNRHVTLLDDEELGPEERSSQDVLNFRRWRTSMRDHDRDVERPWNYAANGDSDARDASPEDQRFHNSAASRVSGRHRFPEYNRHREERHGNRHVTRRATFARRSEGQEVAGSTSSDEDGWHDEHVTRARFCMGGGKYKVAIRFDPPVSGRFILLKMWSFKSNVDVQTIIAKGYGGSRFFPAVELR